MLALSLHSIAAAEPAATPETAALTSRCAALGDLSTNNGRVSGALLVAAGLYDPRRLPLPADHGVMSGYPFEAPSFCRVRATLTPSADSDVRMEIWLPAVGWNGKFMMVGNGGGRGEIFYSSMPGPLKRGYAVASTDTGHAGRDPKYRIGHPEKWTDFLWRGTHETVTFSKRIIEAFYARPPRFSFFDGCSAGGRQGLVEVQKFPSDFDGAIIGAPARGWGLQIQALWANRAAYPNGPAAVIGDREEAILHEAVLAQCDGLDGVRDDEIADPRRCAFDPASIACAENRSSDCLTPEQVEAAEKIYAPARDARDGAIVSPGLPPGSEKTWGLVIGAPSDGPVLSSAFGAGWSARSFDFGADIDRVYKSDPELDVTTSFSAFKARGGKIIQFHGWADPMVPSEDSINFYEAVAAKHGGLDETRTFYRLFMTPGMGHCSGGYDVDQSSTKWMVALEQWVEQGAPPAKVVATRIVDGPAPWIPQRTEDSLARRGDLGERPICAYPAAAVFKGTGSSAVAENFECKVSPRGARASQRTLAVTAQDQLLRSARPGPRPWRR